MATDAQIQAVVNAVVASFDADPALWTAFLNRAKLETELAQLESAQRLLAATFATNQQAYNDALAANQAAQAAKTSEIDALS